MRRAVPSLLMLLAIPAPAQAAGGGDPRAAIEALNQKFVAAAVAKDGDAIGKMYTTDAEILPPGHPIVKGREEITKFWKAAMEQLKLTSLKTQEVHPSGAFAVEVGAWAGSTPDGKSVAGKYMVLWKKVGGSWQLYRDMWSDNGTPEPPKATPTSTTPAATPSK
jgi:uncharacterized protein (TIGR02246 family)